MLQEIKQINQKRIPRITSPELCFECGAGNPDYLRCELCETKHQQLVAELELRPKPPIKKKPKPKLIPIKKKMQGVMVTTWYEKEDLILMGIPIPEEYKENEKNEGNEEKENK